MKSRALHAHLLVANYLSGLGSNGCVGLHLQKPPLNAIQLNEADRVKVDVQRRTKPKYNAEDNGIIFKAVLVHCFDAVRQHLDVSGRFVGN